MPEVPKPKVCLVFCSQKLEMVRDVGVSLIFSLNDYSFLRNQTEDVTNL